MDLVVVGAGLFGLTIAERAAQAGRRVLIIEKRLTIGGNAHSYVDPATGIEIHAYGSHLFHTSNAIVWNYVNEFTKFNNYVHKVFTFHKGGIYSLPINLGTINAYFNLALNPTEAKTLIDSQRNHFQSSEIRSFEDKAISLIGLPLYEAFIKGYTQKQWQTPPSELPVEVISRLPVRFNYRNEYFDDTWQGLPLNGYQAWFERMLDHKNIEIALNVDFLDDEHALSKNSLVGRVPVIYCGPIDRYFEYQYGVLGWRTLDFDISRVEVADFQGNSVMNYADLEIPFTRIHEFRHLHPERQNSYSETASVISREFSRFAGIDDEPFYPINAKADVDKLKLYRELSRNEKNVYFGGRLGSYKYLDMHMAIAAALNLWNNRLVAI